MSKTERQDEMGLLWMRTDWPSGKEQTKQSSDLPHLQLGSEGKLAWKRKVQGCTARWAGPKADSES